MPCAPRDHLSSRGRLYEHGARRRQTQHVLHALDGPAVVRRKILLRAWSVFARPYGMKFAAMRQSSTATASYNCKYFFDIRRAKLCCRSYRGPRQHGKRKQGQSPAPMRSQSTGHLRLLFFWSGREFFAPPVFLPQTWTATSGAQYCCADALHSADMLLIPYSGPFCHHGCRALHHKASSRPPCAGAA